MNKDQQPKYSFDRDGRFVIENYNASKPFSNFFPGIAGLMGTPMWVFYVNRGQCISSFGVESKNKSILEFQPANKAYRLTSLQGFRTFLKITSGTKKIFWEPFQSGVTGGRYRKVQRMSISSHDLIIEEKNLDLKLTARVKYFTVPDEKFAGLVRQVVIENNGPKGCQVEMVDGLPVIVPYGLKDDLNKNISRTIEAWVQVKNIKTRVPFYQLSVEVSDKPQVVHIDQGNFFFSFDPKSSANPLQAPLVESALVFGQQSDFLFPDQFIKGDFKIPAVQQTSNRSPSAMSYSKFSLKGSSQKEIDSVFGYVTDEVSLKGIVKKALQKGFIDGKSLRNASIIDELKQNAFTLSESKEFNMYSANTFMDNVLRGGFPISIPTSTDPVTFNVYSRKHGDLERDYNYFVLNPTFYSQGNGNYRDVNQNRRNDVWFNKDVADQHVVTFMNLIQADGYNPLIVKGASFVARDQEKLNKALASVCDKDSLGMIESFVGKHFFPGDLLMFVAKEKIKVNVPIEEFLGRVLEHCHRHESAEHGEGYWADHWSYNLDLIESYLSLYPERLEDLVLGNKSFSYYLNSHYVLPQNRRYVLTPLGVRQYHSVHHDKEILAHSGGHFLRSNHGKGPIYHTHLLSKILCLIANKIATLDPEGIGVEMEADKPNWDDSLNGLPGLLGSSLCETIEIKRYSQFVLDVLEKIKLSEKTPILIFEELAGFISGLTQVFHQGHTKYDYWLKANGLKELYREKIRRGINGTEQEIVVSDIKDFLKAVVAKVDASISGAKNPHGGLSSYFYYEVTEFEKLKGGSLNYVQPLQFRKHALPSFLEGYVHAFRVAGVRTPAAKALYRQVRSSSLFDQKLKMYKLNEDLTGETEEIGRCRIFPRGWLENESVWLHMEYKFLIELLRCGLYEEFYENFKNVIVAFQDPKRYGRSPLENSSFVVSSAHKDPELHGQGFVARLSGSTAEFLHMWLLMNVGPAPFRFTTDEKLTCHFQPVLPGHLFTKSATTAQWFDGRLRKWCRLEFPSGIYAFCLLGTTLVVYHNAKRRDTFGEKKAVIKGFRLKLSHQKDSILLKTSFIPAPYAEQLRNGNIERIDVHFE